MKRTGLRRTGRITASRAGNFPAAEGPVRWSSLTRHAEMRPRLAVVTADGAPVVALPRRRGMASTIPADVLRLVDERDGHMCVHCGRYRDVIEHHHRRIKGSGGDVRAHTECPCVILSLCPWWTEPYCHPWAHANRREAEAEGLIIPRATLLPALHPVLVHGEYDGGGAKAWPTCAGQWTTDDPDGAAA